MPLIETCLFVKRLASDGDLPPGLEKMIAFFLVPPQASALIFDRLASFRDLPCLFLHAETCNLEDAVSSHGEKPYNNSDAQRSDQESIAIHFNVVH